MLKNLSIRTLDNLSNLTPEFIHNILCSIFVGGSEDISDLFNVYLCYSKFNYKKGVSDILDSVEKAITRSFLRHVTLQHDLIPLPESFFLNYPNGEDYGVDYHDLLELIQQIDPSWSLFFDTDSVSIVNFENTPIKTLGDYHWSVPYCSNISQCEDCEPECFLSNLETKRAELVFCFPRMTNETDLLYDWELNLAGLGIKRIYK